METFGLDTRLGGYVMPSPANLHVHFRFDHDMMELVIPHTAEIYSYATMMPNFGKDRIRTSEQAISYKKRALGIARSYNEAFDGNVPFYIEPDTDPRMVVEGFKAGAWIAGKLYPRGGTTGSAEGVDFRELYRLDRLFRAMEEHDIILLGHFEPTHAHGGAEIDPWFREERALEFVANLLHYFPRLRIVWEHVSSKKVVDAIRAWKKRGSRIEATVAPQYLLWYRGDLLRGGMQPMWYSIPVLKTQEDREAVCQFVLDEHGFAGDDSAPHPVGKKAQAFDCPGGVFNAPASFWVYFRFFKSSGLPDWFERFVGFVALRGRRFYGLPTPSVREVVIIEDPWRMPMTYGVGNNVLVPMLRGEEMPHSLLSIKEAQARASIAA